MLRRRREGGSPDFFAVAEQTDGLWRGSLGDSNGSAMRARDCINMVDKTMGMAFWCIAF